MDYKSQSVRKKLDPRLRRLLEIQTEQTSVAKARRRGEVQSPSTLELTPSVVTKRVLVELNGDYESSSMSKYELSKIAGNIYSAEVPLSELEGLAEQKSVENIEAGRKWYPLLDTSLSETAADVIHSGSGGAPTRNGAGVVVGIIDFGMDFTLDDFRHADSTTRLAFLWDQSLSARAGERSPANFFYGVEYDEAEINQALSSTDPFQTVRHKPGPASHGTHVAGIAASNGRGADNDFAADTFVGAAPGATIIFVQPDSSDQASTFTDSSNVADAIAYVFEKAEELGMPCVINMSLGQNGGSHDGESILERAIDRMLETAGRAFVSAAGNEHVWRGHASGMLAPGAVRELGWKIGGGMPTPSGGSTGIGIDRTPSEMEIWYSSRDRFRVIVTDPMGNSTPAIDPDGNAFLDTLNPSTDVFVDSERFTVFNGDSRIYIQLEPAGNNASVARGIWRVAIEALEADEGQFNAWIERDFRDADNNFADQSFFMGADFDPVKTLGTPATTRRALAVANYDHRVLSPNDSSSRGPTRTNLRKPELSAPGTGILASCALGGRPDGDGGNFPMRVAKSGTSMAAPHVAGVVALLMEEEPGISNAQIAGILKATADNPTGATGFDNAWGYGRVNAQRALALLRDPNQPARPAAIV